MFTLVILAGVIGQYANGLVHVPLERPDGTVRTTLPIQPVTLEGSLKKQGYTASRLIKTSISGMFLVKVDLNGRPFTLLLDTGATCAIGLGKTAGKSLGFESDTYQDNTLVNSNAIKSFKYGVGVLDSVRILSGDYQDQQSHNVRIFDGFSYADTVRNIKTDHEDPVVVDGLLGQTYLSDNCAIIDHESATLFLMPFATREMTKLAGSWCGTRGERDGKPLVGIEQCQIEFQSNGDAEYTLLDKKSEGSVRVRGVGIYKLMYLGIKEPNSVKRLYAKGIYSVEGDTLKLVIFDDTAEMKPPAEGDKRIDPTKFEAKKDSGHIYFEFTRKKEIQKLVGAWECVSGIRDGKPVADLSENSILIRGDRSSNLSLFGIKSKGYLQLVQYDTQRIFSIGTMDEQGKTTRSCWGIYSVVGDTLKVAIVDKTYKKLTEVESAEQRCPEKFEAKKDSGHIYFEFNRKPLNTPKK